MPSFDIVSEVDMPEVTNSVDQANKELKNRFDFNGVNAQFKLEKESIVLSAPEEFQLKQMFDILMNKAVKRGLDVECFKAEEVQKNLAEAKQTLLLQTGIDKDIAKKLTKFLKDSKIKIQISIQGDQLRVTGKKRDDLQSAIAMLKEKSWGIPLQYQNFRD